MSGVAGRVNRRGEIDEYTTKEDVLRIILTIFEQTTSDSELLIELKETVKLWLEGLEVMEKMNDKQRP